MRHAARWVTRTAVFTALLVVVQAASAPLGSTLVTGSAVNALLVLAAMLGGAGCGLGVALLSPVLARLVGIGPLWSLIPFIVLGNVTFVLVWRRLAGRGGVGRRVAALVAGAVCKAAVLYLGIARFAVPVLLRLPEPQAGAVSALFSLPQLFTALLGGTAALALLPPLERALRADRAGRARAGEE